MTLVLISPGAAKAKKKAAAEETEVKRSAPEMGLFEDWKKVKNRKVDKTFGIVRVKAIPGRGTFNISVVNDREKSIGVLSNLNEYTSSYFSLKSGKKIIKLQGGTDVKTKARATEDKVQIIYSVDKVADVLVEFVPVESMPGQGFDMLKIQTFVTNTGKKAVDMALKNIMDTVLGEADLHHFYTSEDIPVRTELSFRTMSNAQYFNSKNSAAWCQFLFSGADITPIDIVALVNYASADSYSWEPVVVSNRSFDTVTAYNNSAVDIIWPSKRVLREQTVTNVYYMAFASEGNRPKGPEYIAARARQLKSGQAAAEINSVANAVETKEEAAEVITSKAEEKPAVTVNTEIIVDEPETKDKTPVKQMFTQDYINSLLKRIEALEASDPTLNREELKTLNDELDFILSVMRS